MIKLTNKDFILEGISKHTIFKYDDLTELYNLIKSYDEVLNLCNIAMKYNMKPIEVYDRLTINFKGAK